MEIYINGESVGFILEGEQTLQEVIGNIEQYLQVHNHFMDEIIINGKETEYHVIRECTLPLEDVQKIEITALSVVQKSQSFANDLQDKLKHLLSFQKDQIFENKETILSELKNLYKGLDILSNFLVVPFIYVFKNGHYMKVDMEKLSSLTKILEEKIRDEGEFSRVFFSQMLPILELVDTLYLHQLLHVYTLFFLHDEAYLSENFTRDIQESVSHIRDALENVGETTALFQMGEDAKAVADLEIFLILYEFVSQLVLRCSFLKLLDTQSVSNLQSELQEDIRQMNESLLQKDIITLCDVLEYEYIPHLQDLLNLLPSVAK